MKILFMGTPDFSVPVLQRILEEGHEVVGVVTQPDRPKGRKKTLTPPPVKVEAEKHDLPVFQPEKIREKDQLSPILETNPEIVVTAAYGQLLPNELLDAPSYGCINVHASLLPKYRGGAPIHQAIIDGEKESGISIMYMVEKLDAGDVLSQVRVPIDEKDTVGTLHDKLSEAGADLLSDTLIKIKEGTIQAEPQNENKVTFASNIQRGQELLDWNKTGEELYNQIRGMNPWPVAYTVYNEKPVKIWWAEKTASPKKGKPGEVLSIEENGIIVGTGDDTAIKIKELQPSGKKRLKASDYLRGAGTALKEGDRFGDDQG
ncbi:methionyl-tRNA formyltransferase [Thalassobacillus sp. C254]|uniref:methionyl-tRNA formyltransferase n=1 Tax=Thalassobacillus sp. C254 TaxID=1225341 RepID=UPI0006D222AA|nr:methionyl-tRNA formyltransferase [Thalassobacillus sp. C254]